MIYAAVLAGGSGTRFGAELPKQFLPLSGRPVIIRSLDAFIRSGLCGRVLAAVGAGHEELMRELLREYLPGEDVTVVTGGRNRNETLLAVLREIGDAEDGDIILTHDAVRPFIDDRIIAENITAAGESGACNTVIPAVDTILRSRDGVMISEVPPRVQMYHAQTPQTFRLRRLRELYASMTERELEEYTDACTVFVERGENVRLVTGSPDNIKITFPEDIKRAEEIALRRGEAAPAQ